MVIQLVYIGGNNYLAIKGIKPDKDNPETGEILLVTNTEKRERYHTENKLLVTDNFLIPMDFIVHFLISNNCVRIGDDGKEYVILKEVEFRINNLKN